MRTEAAPVEGWAADLRRAPSRHLNDTKNVETAA
jgi:hypothetical protein